MPLIPTQRLDKKIDILVKTTYKNDKFEWVTEWSVDRTIWCSVKTQYFKDYKEAIGTILEDTVNFIIRFDQRKPVTSDLRINYKGVNYEIISVLEGSYERDFTTIVAKRVKK